MAIAISGVLAIAALSPAIAAARITVPPGSTEGDQYFEEVPNGGGGGSPDRDLNAGGSGGSPGVAATQALNALGPEGVAAADLANSNRPPSKSGSASDQQSSSSEGDGGLGSLFPILLVVTALAAIAYGLRRRLTPA
jgi:hypothetical protein